MANLYNFIVFRSSGYDEIKMSLYVFGYIVGISYMWRIIIITISISNRSLMRMRTQLVDSISPHKICGNGMLGQYNHSIYLICTLLELHIAQRSYDLFGSFWPFYSFSDSQTIGEKRRITKREKIFIFSLVAKCNLFLFSFYFPYFILHTERTHNRTIQFSLFGYSFGLSFAQLLDFCRSFYVYSSIRRDLLKLNFNKIDHVRDDVRRDRGCGLQDKVYM